MENNPIETVPETDAVVEVEVQTPATEDAPIPEEVEAPASENSTSTEEDLDALIAEEKKRGPDPKKAHERIQKAQHKEEVEEEPDYDSVETPLTREEVERLIAERTQSVYVEANAERIVDLSERVSESSKEAELVREIHRNRIFPPGMSLQDQIIEAHAIATAKRTQAKAMELARKVKSSENVSRNTATTHRDPQSSPQPKVAPDLAASMQRAGYTYNGQMRRYEKVLPNGKILVKESGKPPYLAN